MVCNPLSGTQNIWVRKMLDIFLCAAPDFYSAVESKVLQTHWVESRSPVCQYGLCTYHFCCWLSCESISLSFSLCINTFGFVAKATFNNNKATKKHKKKLCLHINIDPKINLFHFDFVQIYANKFYSLEAIESSKFTFHLCMLRSSPVSPPLYQRNAFLFGAVATVFSGKIQIISTFICVMAVLANGC